MNFLNLSQKALVLSKSYDYADAFLQNKFKKFRFQVCQYLENHEMIDCDSSSSDRNLICEQGAIGIGVRESVQMVDGIYAPVVLFFLKSREQKEISLGKFVICFNDSFKDGKEIYWDVDGTEIYWDINENKKINQYLSFVDLMENGVGKGISDEKIATYL